MKFVDLTGQRFGRLTVIKRVENNGKKVMWLCRCDCGNETTVFSGCLRAGHTKSCGCLNIYRIKERRFKHGESRKTRLYSIWKGMRKRTSGKATDKDTKKYYTSKNIKMCEEWYDFRNFRDWANANGYDDALTIDRIDGNKGYSPENCRWANADVQNRNKSNNINITRNGETKCLKDWCKELGLKYRTICKRIASGWDTEKALTTPKIVGRPKNK